MSDSVIQQAPKLKFGIHMIVPSKLVLAEIFATCTLILGPFVLIRETVKKSKEIFFLH